MNRIDNPKILLINPPWYKMLGGELVRFPLGLGYLAGILDERDFDVSIYNADYESRDTLLTLKRMEQSYHDYLETLNNLEHPLWQEVRDTISSHQPNIVGVSVMTATYGSALNIAQIAKEINPKSIIVFGGVHPTIMPEETIQAGNIDIVVNGEGEQTFLELVENLDSEKWREVQGITYKDGDKVVHNPPRPLVKDLDELPFPARHRILNAKELPPNAFGYIFASRGCPYNCNYCASYKTWGRRVRYRSPENVVQEIELVNKTYATNYFRFDDDTFAINSNFTEGICELILSKGLKIKWSCETRPNLATDELLKTMKKAGCDRIYLGVESGDPETLKLMRKGVTVEQIKSACKLIKKNGINLECFFMIGFPWETEEQIYRTVSLMKEIDPDGAVYSTVTPYPGTELYDVCAQEGVLPEDINWSSFYHQSPEMHLPKHLSKEKFAEIVRDVQQIFDSHNLKKMRRRLLFHPLRTAKQLYRRVTS